MYKLGIGLRLLLGVVFIGSSIGKVVGATDSIRDQLEIAPWFWLVVAAIELFGGIGLLASVRESRLALPFGIWFVVLMIGALIAHIRVDDAISVMMLPIVLLFLSIIVTGIALRSGETFRDVAA